MIRRWTFAALAVLAMTCATSYGQEGEGLQAPVDLAEVAKDQTQVEASESVKQFWAVVDKDGNLRLHDNAVRAKKLGVGFYEVIFTKNVSKALYLCSIGTHFISGAEPGQVSLSPRAGNAQGVFVRTTNSSGVQLDLGFHLFVLIK